MVPLFFYASASDYVTGKGLVPWLRLAEADSGTLPVLAKLENGITFAWSIGLKQLP